MGNNVQFQAATIASPPSATIVETIDEGGAVERQVVCIGSLGKAGSETQVTTTLPISAASLPLPTGAAQESGGNLATLAGIVSGGKAAVSGTVTANAGTNLNTSALALESGGNLAAIAANTQASASSGGVSSTFRLLSSTNTTNSNNVKASAGRVYQLLGYNASSSVRYLKLYNKASAPTIGTDTPVKTIALPPNTAFVIDHSSLGYYFSTGIGFGITGAAADNDTTAVGAGDIVALNIDYA